MDPTCLMLCRRHSSRGLRPAVVAPVQVVDVAGLLARAQAELEHRVLWSASNQLHTNVVALRGGEAVDWHAESELDVTLTVLVGSAELRYGTDQTEQRVYVNAPSVVVLPAGTRRAITAGRQGVTYLTAHRARTGLLPRLR